MHKFSSDYIAVGVTASEEGLREGLREGVVVHLGGLGHFVLSENMARKLADDILRNANHLWPVDEETQENT